jgi:putative flippase GtrA
MKKLPLYLLFAAIAIGVNYAVLNLSDKVLQPILPYDKWRLLLSQVLAIGSGFVVKYILDKFYVFKDAIATKKEEYQKALLYGMMSIITTALYMSISWGFYFLVSPSSAKTTGALIGLLTGYTLKFFLDKKYVFRQ